MTTHQMMKNTLPTISMAAALFAGASWAQAAVISVNSATSGNELVPADVVGAVAVANWNNTSTVSGGSSSLSVPNAVDDSGTATTTDFAFAGVTFVYTNNTADLGGTLTDDSKMMRSHRATSNTSSMSVTATSITYDEYDVYVYWGGTHGNASQTSIPQTMTLNLQLNDGSSWVTQETKYIKDSNRVWDGSYNESTATASANAVDGNEYVVFRGLDSSSFRVAVSATKRNGISGIQIVEAPEPATLALLALGGLMMIPRKRVH